MRPSLTTRTEIGTAPSARPKRQTQARQRWLAAREGELLATSYFHVVFTVPHELKCAGLGQRAFDLWPAVHRQRANADGDRGDIHGNAPSVGPKSAACIHRFTYEM